MPLPLPVDPRSIVYDAVVNRLKSDPVLSRVVKQWESTPYHQIDPSAANLPLIVIGLMPGSIQPHTPQSNAVQLVIRLDIVVPGYDHRDLINLYGAVETAIDPFGMLDYIKTPLSQTNGRGSLFGNVIFTQQGYQYEPLPGKLPCIGATAAFTIPLKINPSRGE